MSGSKDQFQRARVILDSLVRGVHPKTGCQLSENSIANDVSRSVVTAVLALNHMSARLSRRAQFPESVGKAWTKEEQRQLRDEFSASEPIPLIATKHGRTIRAIETRAREAGADDSRSADER